MEEIKSHFTFDGSSFEGNRGWFLIDTDDSLKTKKEHIVCIATHNPNSVQYEKGSHNLKYLIGRDELLPKPSILQYNNASGVLKERGLRYNKKKGKVIKKKL